MYTFLIFHACYMFRPSHPLDLITLIILGEGFKLRSSSLCRLLQPQATSSHLGPNIILSQNLEKAVK